MIYDGTFEGFMTAVATGLENQLPVARITSKPMPQAGLFTSERQIVPNRRVAKALWDTVGSRGSGLQRMVYFAFLAARQGKESAIFNYLKLLLQPDGESQQDSRQELRSRLEAWALQVEGEKHDIESGLSFHPNASGVACGAIAPRHDVLPLLSRYFRLRFGNAPWMVYDTRRQYGLKSENGQVTVIRKGAVAGDAVARGPQPDADLVGISPRRAYRTAV